MASSNGKSFEVSIQEEIQLLLNELGTGRIDGVAYDTAWTARLNSYYPGEGFERSLEWLRQNQKSDGTWGALALQNHDRFVSTASAIIALRENGEERDERRVWRGEAALWKLLGGLEGDDNDTIGFPIVSAALIADARELGLSVPEPPVRFADGYNRKVRALLDLPVRQWQKSPLSFSLEGLIGAVTEQDTVLGRDGSVSISPSATSAFLIYYRNPKASSWMQGVLQKSPDGSIPALMPIDVFETVWALIHLSNADAVRPDEPVIRDLVEKCWKLWSPESGISHSSHFSVTDVDDTAASLTVLNWAGYPVHPEVFRHFEADDHFCCYIDETNISVSAHVRLLAALRKYPQYDDSDPWIQKIKKVLKNFDTEGPFWKDKWHASPYYVTAAAVHALYGLDAKTNNVAESRLKWILRTQRDDGGWGYYNFSTPEETAYCMEALLWWDRSVSRIDGPVLDRAAKFLMSHIADKSFTPLWIGKSLYSPHNVVRALILAVMLSYTRQRSQIRLGTLD